MSSTIVVYGPDKFQAACRVDLQELLVDDLLELLLDERARQKLPVISGPQLYKVTGTYDSGDHRAEDLEKPPIAASRFPNTKREPLKDYMEDPVEANRRIRLAFAANNFSFRPTKFESAKAIQRYHEQRRTSLFRCGRPSDNLSTFPIVLAHPIFASFVSDCKTYQPAAEDLRLIVILSKEMSDAYESEVERVTKFVELMDQYGIPVAPYKIPNREDITNGDLHHGNYFYLIVGARKDSDAASGDAYIQSRAYYLAAAQNVAAQTTRALPCMHIFSDGMQSPHDLDLELQTRAAKMFGALKPAVAALKAHYEAPEPRSPPDTRFPWITQYHPINSPTSTRTCKYLKRLKALDVCQDLYLDKLVLVKFVQRYSPEAHLAAADLGAAPDLYGCHELPICCGWSIVVMELLEESEWSSGSEITDSMERDMVRKEVEKHVSGFVHGDNRTTNVVLKRNEDGETVSVRLIDFDWAGKIGEARYPLLINPVIGPGSYRPSGVEGGELIKTKHDLTMAEFLYNEVFMQFAHFSG
ncbi:hypothetical protein FRB90_003520 [Tulasnella sp. 427]|nr:hypothetical protein FRB90_003520 [Tulasnella sp. 427]